MILGGNDGTHMGTCNDGVRVGSPASRGRMMNLVGRISRGKPNTLPVAIGASRNPPTSACSSLRQIRRRGPSSRNRGQHGSVRCGAIRHRSGGTGGFQSSHVSVESSLDPMAASGSASNARDDWKGYCSAFVGSTGSPLLDELPATRLPARTT